MFELDAKPHAELLEIAPQRAEVDPQLVRDCARLIARERPLVASLTVSTVNSFA
jgi:hypothetical protein